ncbi:MAG: glycoside hydrolase [Clostridia bacterium]|nr:glycoside hydrolase [Clostridia bacterium]
MDLSSRISGMSLREKVGQLFCIRPESLEESYSAAELNEAYGNGTKSVTEGMRALYEDYPCGGFALFLKNIESPEQLRTFTADLHAMGGIRPLLCIDEEGGNVARIANHPSFDVPRFSPMGTLGQSGKEEDAYDAGKTIGQYLKEFGLDVDFAPVADVNTNPLNPIIGLRAFSSDPAVASRLVQQFLYGLHESGVAGCLKHFPGHGDTKTDTHTGYAETLKSWDELVTCEMLPFIAGISAGTDMIMTAHIAAPNVTCSSVPSTVSPLILTEKLRGELGYEGIIITDALAMGAITQEYTSAEASILCLEAGADIILMPFDYVEAFDGLMEAVESGRVPENRIDESVTRILLLREKLGLL